MIRWNWFRFMKYLRIEIWTTQGIRFHFSRRHKIIFVNPKCLLLSQCGQHMNDLKMQWIDFVSHVFNFFFAIIFFSFIFFSNRISDRNDISDDFSFQLVPHTTISECEIECQTIKTIRFNFSFSVFIWVMTKWHSRDGARKRRIGSGENESHYRLF